MSFSPDLNSPEYVAGALSCLRGKEPFLFLDSAVSSGRDTKSLMFAGPEDIITGSSPDDVSVVFSAVEEALRKGKYVAGYFTYEWGYCMEPALHHLLQVHRPKGPLVWLGVFDSPLEIKGFATESLEPPYLKQDDLPALFLESSREDFRRDLEAIKEFIASGDTYQVNYTVRSRFSFDRDPLGLYFFLRRRQPVKYGAFISHDNRDVLSFSPELFFSMDGGVITARPMKGTMGRGTGDQEDEAMRSFLEGDIKNRAENVMIVDLLRNDLGRVSEPGSVTVPELFTVEPYETLFQMTSTVRGRLRPKVTWEEIFRAIYPCGSITGAPKIRTMEIIAALETSPRGIYTGAIGYMAPDGRAMFNVAIRTIILEKGSGEMGIGSGITWGSDPYDEFSETLLKAEFFSSDIREDKSL